MSRKKLLDPSTFSPEGRDLFERLDRLRKALGIDQEGLAKSLGIKQAAVWQWEADKSFPSAKNCAKLAELSRHHPEDRRFFIQHALKEAAFVRDLAMQLNTEEQKWLCQQLGLGHLISASWDHVERRKAAGRARAK